MRVSRVFHPSIHQPIQHPENASPTDVFNWLQHLFTARALERELSESKARERKLEAELADVKARNKQLEQQAENSHDVHLDGESERILAMLAGHQEVSESELASSLGIGPQRVAYHLGELKRRRLVSAQFFAGGLGYDAVTEWSLEQPGRAYLFQRGLLK